MYECTTPPTRLLEDVSSTGKVRPWRKHKSTSRSVSASMYRIAGKLQDDRAWRKRAGRVWVCGDYLQFIEVCDTDTGELTRRLQAAQFCRDRLCPMCSWRKSLVTFAQVSALMDALPDYVPIMATYTLRNVGMDELDDGVTHLLRAWSRMTSSRTNPHWSEHVEGWFRALEITYNEVSHTWHPHLHAILLVQPKYFTDPTMYLDHDQWVALWRWAARLDYDPSVDVHTLKGDRAHAVAEVSKYTVKPGDWVCDTDPDGTDQRIYTLANTLRGRRLTAFGGVMAQVRKELDQEDVETADLVNVDGQEIRSDLIRTVERYEWQVGVSNYVCVRCDTPPCEV